MLITLTLAGTTADVRDEPSAAGVWLGRAHLTRMTPGPANGGTTECLGTHNATQLTLAHLVVDLCEAWASSVICKKIRVKRVHALNVRYKPLISVCDTRYVAPMEAKCPNVTLKTDHHT